jgi:rSAM/selenodomain-associated transferase 1
MQTLGMFAKYWQLGKVKSRLAAKIGDQSAAEVYRLFLEHLSQKFSKTADTRILAYAPIDRKMEFISLAGSDWQTQVQKGADLGEKMADFFSQQFTAGNAAVVLIGSDSPQLTPDYITAAFVAIQQSDIVIGPASDGGYVLVGMRKLTPGIFSGISWSTPDVLAQTFKRAEDLKLSVATLDTCFDVDTLADLQKLLTLSEPDLNQLQSDIRKVLSPDDAF